MILEVLKLITLLAFIMGVNEHLGRDKRTKYYREDEIQHVADSLMNNWKENALKYDTL